MTRLGEHGVPDDVWDEAVKHWSQEELANLILAIGTINAWNRLGVLGRLAWTMTRLSIGFLVLRHKVHFRPAAHSQTDRHRSSSCSTALPG